MEAFYTKEKDYYVAHLGEITFCVPFKLSWGEFGTVDVTDDLMDLLIYRYDNDCLEWKYEGKIVTEDTVKKLIEEGYKASNLPFDLTVKYDREYLECPYCLEYGLTLFDYGDDDVYECVKCGAEIWYWQKKGILATCEEIKNNRNKGV